MRTVKILGIAALLCILPAVALATPPQGVWRGVIQNGNDNVGVDANFGANSVDVHFQAPFSCKVKARYVKPDGRDLIYIFDLSTNGGRFCDGLLHTSLEVTHSPGDDSMKIALTSSGTKSGKWTGELQQQTNSP
jgi:hypothetical protein